MKIYAVICAAEKSKQEELRKPCCGYIYCGKIFTTFILSYWS
jgi:hypothetical protein